MCVCVCLRARSCIKTSVGCVSAQLDSVLGEVGGILTECFDGDAHFAALYDIRQYKLPPIARCQP